MTDNTLKISMPVFGNIQISLNEEKYIFNMATKKGHEEMTNFLESLTNLAEWNYIWNEYIKFYKNFDAKTCDKIIKKTVNGFQVDENFAIFLENRGIKTNSDAKILFQTEYVQSSKISITDHKSHLTVESKDKKSLKDFIMWNYEKHIKPTLKDVKSNKI